MDFGDQSSNSAPAGCVHFHTNFLEKNHYPFSSPSSNESNISVILDNKERSMISNDRLLPKKSWYLKNHSMFLNYKGKNVYICHGFYIGYWLFLSSRIIVWCLVKNGWVAKYQILYYQIKNFKKTDVVVKSFISMVWIREYAYFTIGRIFSTSIRQGMTLGKRKWRQEKWFSNVTE